MILGKIVRCPQDFLKDQKSRLFFPVVALMKEMGADILIVHFKSYCANLCSEPPSGAVWTLKRDTLQSFCTMNNVQCVDV